MATPTMREFSSSSEQCHPTTLAFALKEGEEEKLRQLKKRYDGTAEIINIQRRILSLTDAKIATRSLGNDSVLLGILRQRKGDLTSALKNADDMIKWIKEKEAKDDQPSIIPLPSEYKDILQSGVLLPLAKPDEGGSVALLWRVGKWNVRKRSFADLLNGISIIFGLVMQRQLPQLNGIVYVVDCSGFSYGHAFSLTKTALSLIFTQQEKLPLRVKAIHILNNNSLFQFVYNFVAPVLKTKLKSRILVHGNKFSTLHKHLPPTMLPKIYDGTLDGELWAEEGLIDLILASEDDFKYTNLD